MSVWRKLRPGMSVQSGVRFPKALLGESVSRYELEFWDALSG